MSFEPFVAYEASAGSGKTFQLTVRYLSLLFLDQTAESILCVTFTKKAATQMRERIVEALTKLDDTMCELISLQTGIPQTMLLQKQPDVKQRFLKSNPNILNIDKFFTKVLHSFSYEAGIDPNFKVISTIDFKQLFDKFIQKNDNLDDFIELFLTQSSSIKSLFELFEKLYEYDPLLPDAAKEVGFKDEKQRVIDAMTRVQTLLFECKDASAQVKKMVTFKDIEDIMHKSFLKKQSLSEHRNFKKCFTPALDTAFFELKTALQHYAQKKESFIISNLLHFYSIYKDIRNHRHTLQFNDVTQKVFELLHGIDKEFLYFRLDAKYKHILIDEFQDTSLTQFHIFKPLIDEITSGYGQDQFKSFFYVGDVKQSIYRFRGGHKSLFYEVANNYPIVLKQMQYNFRSTEQIVSYVNENFHFMDGFIDQVAKKEGGYVETAFVSAEEKQILETIVQKVKILKEKGYSEDDITLLFLKNQDAQLVENRLKTDGYKVITESSSKLTANVKVAALINAIKYLIYKEPLYKKNFQHYCYEYSEIDIEFSILDAPFTVLDRLIKKFKFFEDDINILKLLEISQNYSDILEFLHDEIDEGSASQQTQGIRLMTVHKSKGLEFENVIVVDSFSKDRPDTQKLIMRDKALGLDSMHYKIKDREYYDNEYAKLLQKQKELKQQDLEHALYVAFTRAEQNLFLIVKEKDSKLNHLQLNPTKKGELKPKQSVQYTHTPQKKIYYKKIGVQESEKSQNSGAIDYEATLFGTALHYCMEQLEKFDHKALAKALSATKNRYANYIDINEIENRVTMLLTDDRFTKLCKGKIIKEKPILYNQKLKQLDMLIEKEDCYLIIDYKTSQKNRFKDKKQVAEYKEILEDIADKKTQGVIVYLIKDGIEIEWA